MRELEMNPYVVQIDKFVHSLEKLSSAFLSMEDHKSTITEEEYQEYGANQGGNEPGTPDNIKSVKADKSKSGIYTILGVKVSDNAEDIDNLPKGLYIINGKKYIK